MAKTLLQGVNELLKRVSIIQGESQEFSSLTSTNRQQSIDVAIQVWNEVIDGLYSNTPLALEQELASSTIVLATDVDEYTLPSNMVEIRWLVTNVALPNTRRDFQHQKESK